MNVDLVTAIGNALTALTSLLQREGVLDMERYAGLLAMMGSPDMDARPGESEILRTWAGMIQDVAEGIAKGDTPH